MYFEQTKAIKEILKNRVSSPSYYKYLGTGFSGIIEELSWLSQMKKEAKTREEYDAIEKEIADLRFLLRNKHDIEECNPPFVTEEERQQIISTLEKEEAEAKQAYNDLQKELKLVISEYLGKVLELREKAAAIQFEAKQANLSQFPFLPLYTSRPNVTQGALESHIQQIISESRKVVK